MQKLAGRVKGLEVTSDALINQNTSFQKSLASIRERVGVLESGQKAIIDNSKEKAKIEAKQRKNEDLRAINFEIEESVRKDPDNYLWSHRRFKNRPDGEESFYPDNLLRKR